MASFFSGLFWVFFYGAVFYAWTIAVAKLIAFFRLRQEGPDERWLSFVGTLLEFFSIASGLVVVAAVIYFLQDDEEYLLVVVLAKPVTVYLLFRVIFYLFRWFDEKLGIENKKNFETLFYVLVLVLIVSFFWTINEGNEQTRIKDDLRFRVENHLLGKQHESMELMEGVRLKREPKRMFVSNCVTNFIFDDYSNNISVGINTAFNNLVKTCTESRDKLRPEFIKLINTKLFHDLRPDLAESARGAFFAHSFRRGAKSVKKYISLIGQSRDKGNISRDSLLSHKRQWKWVNEKHGHRLWYDINWEYKVANCEHIVKQGPLGGFGASVAPDEKTLAERKKCREEKNIPIQ